ASGAAARAFGSAEHVATTPSPATVSAAIQGTVLGGYSFKGYKSQSEEDSLAKVDFVVESVSADAQKSLKGATAIAEAVNTARGLITTPPSDLYPASFAERAEKLARSAGLEVEVLDEAALRKQGFGGILGVGSGSSRPPRLVRIRHKGPKSSKKVALVGKGITFDTGGISL